MQTLDFEVFAGKLFLVAGGQFGGLDSLPGRGFLFLRPLETLDPF